MLFSSWFVRPLSSLSHPDKLSGKELIFASKNLNFSQQYQPIDASKLPERVKTKIFHPNVEVDAPRLEDYQVYEVLKRRKLKNSNLPGDIPTKLKKEFLPELCGPATIIFNLITKTGLYPRQWVTEYVTPIPKISLPQSEDNLRPISLTAFPSKVLEQFIVGWLLDVFGHKLDFRQYGGVRGSSICHYLMEFLTFILHQQEK